MCEQLGINRIAQASSVNVIPLVWTERKDFVYFPLDEEHPTGTDEPYGLSKMYVFLSSIFPLVPETHSACECWPWRIE